MLTKETWPKYSGDAKEGCKMILHTIEPEKKFSGDQLQYGKTKIFIRNPEWVNN